MPEPLASLEMTQGRGAATLDRRRFELMKVKETARTGASRTCALTVSGSPLGSSRAVLSALQGFAAAAAEISARCPASAGRHYRSPDRPQSATHQLTGRASPRSYGDRFMINL